MHKLETLKLLGYLRHITRPYTFKNVVTLPPLKLFHSHLNVTDL